MAGVPPSRWTQVTPSRHAHERAALEVLRASLPDHEPWRGWTNFEFVASDGSVNEVDALVVGRSGVFLVEIKSNPGRVGGDAQSLTFTDATGRRTTIRNPLSLANLKAKRLKELIGANFKPGMGRAPWIEPVVFLAGANGCDLADPTRLHLVFDPANAPGCPAVGQMLASWSPRYGPSSQTIDKPLAKAIAAALDVLGIRTRQESQKVGDYVIEALIDETRVHRDLLGRHCTLKHDLRRVRRYFAPTDGSLQQESAERAAQREALILGRLDHPGIIRCTHFSKDDEGPILFLEHTPGAVRLDRWLEEQRAPDGRLRLTARQRFALIRLIAEAVQHAHHRRVVHRCLSPACILVVPDGGGGRDSASDAIGGIKILDWQAGAREGETVGSTALLQATLHPGDYQDIHAAQGAFVAPELHRRGNSADPALDVFSLGALAYLVVTGEAPAVNAPSLLDRLSERRCLRPSDRVDGVATPLDDLIAKATEFAASERLQSVDDFVARLSVVERELLRHEAILADPTQAAAGDHLPDGSRVISRLGSGSHAIAFLIERGGESGEVCEGGAERFVLKLARRPESNAFVQAEAAIVQRLDHPNLVRFAGEFNVGSCNGFLSLPPSNRTLRQVLQEEGSLQVEMLERFGSQLLEALHWLEQHGIRHRDLKPENIAVTDRGRRQAIALVLFDFSASPAPLDALDVGTVPYIDPFLRERPSRRWDSHAERFSAAMVLHEMATGQLPVWGDGRSEPLATQGEVVLDANRFSPGLRDSLLGFFQKGLARKAGGRFPSAEAMLEAWRGAFAQTHHAPLRDAPVDVEGHLDAVLVAGEDTPLADLPLGTRALNAIDRLGLHTVRDLLRLPLNRLGFQRGVGLKTREELKDIARRLRRRFPHVTIDPNAGPQRAQGAPVAPDEAAGDQAQSQLATVDSLMTEVEAVTATPGLRRIGMALLGLDPSPDAPPGQPLTSRLDLPTQTEAGERAKVSRQRAAQVVPKLRHAWAGLPWISRLQDRLHDWLCTMHGVATVAEAASFLLGSLGGEAEEADGAVGGEAGNGRAEGDRMTVSTITPALRKAAALVRVACEVEAEVSQPRWHLRRRSCRQYLVTDDSLIEVAEALAEQAEEVAAVDPLPDPAQAERLLRSRLRPSVAKTVAAIPTGQRLLRLAVEASNADGNVSLGLSSRGELYRAGLSPERAIALTAGALAGAGAQDDTDPGRRLISLDELRERVRSRYPLAAPLPDPPALDALLRGAWLDLTWEPSIRAYASRVGERLSIAQPTSEPARLSTASEPGHLRAPAELNADQQIAARFDRRLRQAASRVPPDLLVLAVASNAYRLAIEQIRRLLPELEVADLDTLILDAVEARLAEGGIVPTTFFDAVAAGPASPRNWDRIGRVMAHAIGVVTERLVGGTRPLLLLHPGLLAQFGDWRPVEAFNSQLGRNTSRPCFLLVPCDDPTARQPHLDHHPIPTLDPSQYAVVPTPWVRNVHHATLTA